MGKQILKLTIASTFPFPSASPECSKLDPCSAPEPTNTVCVCGACVSVPLVNDENRYTTWLKLHEMSLTDGNKNPLGSALQEQNPHQTRLNLADGSVTHRLAGRQVRLRAADMDLLFRRRMEDAGVPQRRSASAARTKKVVRKSCGACRQAGLRWLIHQELQTLRDGSHRGTQEVKLYGNPAVEPIRFVFSITLLWFIKSLLIVQLTTQHFFWFHAEREISSSTLSMTSPWQPSRRPNDGARCNSAGGSVSVCECVGVSVHLCEEQSPFQCVWRWRMRMEIIKIHQWQKKKTRNNTPAV